METKVELTPPKCTYCEQESKYQQDSYSLCQQCADKVNNLILGLYESGESE